MPLYLGTQLISGRGRDVIEELLEGDSRLVPSGVIKEYIDSNTVSAAGDKMTGTLEMAGTAVKTTLDTNTAYSNPAPIYWRASNLTGVLAINFGSDAEHMAADLTLASQNINAKLTLNGYAVNKEFVWARAAGLCDGFKPKVRTAGDANGNHYFLLGETTTSWGGYLHSAITNLLKHADVIDTGHGVKMTVTQDETAFINIKEVELLSGGESNKILSVEMGGTGADNAEDALMNLGAVPLKDGYYIRLGKEDESNTLITPDEVITKDGQMWTSLGCSGLGVSDGTGKVYMGVDTWNEEGVLQDVGHMYFYDGNGDNIRLRGISAPAQNNDAANKWYVDNAVASAGTGAAPADWNQNDSSQPGYIENRTHYCTEPLDIQFSSPFEWTELTDTNSRYYKRGMRVVAAVGTLSLDTHVNTCDITGSMTGDHIGVFAGSAIKNSLGPSYSLFFEVTNTGPQYIVYVYCSTNPEAYGGTITLSNFRNSVPLSEAFIPNSIARTVDVDTKLSSKLELNGDGELVLHDNNTHGSTGVILAPDKIGLFEDIDSSEGLTFTAGYYGGDVPTLQFWGSRNDENVRLQNIESPQKDYDAANKAYVDEQMSQALCVDEYGVVTHSHEDYERSTYMEPGRIVLLDNAQEFTGVAMTAYYDQDEVPALAFWGSLGDERVRLENIEEPRYPSDAANKEYADKAGFVVNATPQRNEDGEISAYTIDKTYDEIVEAIEAGQRCICRIEDEYGSVDETSQFTHFAEDGYIDFYFTFVHSVTSISVGSDYVSFYNSRYADFFEVYEHNRNKSNPHGVTASQINAVPTTRKINNKALSSDITLTADDVGARSSTWLPSLSTLGAVPTTRKVNNKALSSDITLNASDVGAVPTTRTVNGKALSANITLTAADVGARSNTWLPSAADLGLHTVATSGSYNDLTNKPTIPSAYSLPTASSSTLGGIKIGSNLSISSGVLSVPTASGTQAGVTIVYPAASCTTFTSDSGTCTPAAVKKAVGMFDPKAHNHSASEITSGALSIAQGGTGAITAAAALTALGAYSKTEVDNKIASAGGHVVSPSAPTDTSKLWINSSTGVLSYHNGSSWVGVKGVWG